MKAVYKELVDNSLAATLSAIEIYNKPDFRYRDETFVILIINAWELLLKAKILKDNNHQKNALYVKEGNRYKTSRTGNYLTIEIRGALKKVNANDVVIENIESLLELRDTAIHFYNKDTIAYTIFTLGAASLQNYQKLIGKWFNTDLSQYNFYILPLGFKYSFKNFSMIDVSKEPDVVQNLLSEIIQKQSTGTAESEGYYLVADIKTEVVSAKKMADEAQLTIAIDQNSGNKGIIIHKKVTDEYPLTATEISETVKNQLENVKQNQIWDLLRKLKGDAKYSAYNFPSKKYEKEYMEGKRNAPPSLVYKQDALEYVIANIEEVK